MDAHSACLREQTDCALRPMNWDGICDLVATDSLFERETKDDGVEHDDSSQHTVTDDGSEIDFPSVDKALEDISFLRRLTYQPPLVDDDDVKEGERDEEDEDDEVDEEGEGDEVDEEDEGDEVDEEDEGDEVDEDDAVWEKLYDDLKGYKKVVPGHTRSRIASLMALGGVSLPAPATAKVASACMHRRKPHVFLQLMVQREQLHHQFVFVHTGDNSGWIAKMYVDWLGHKYAIVSCPCRRKQFARSAVVNAFYRMAKAFLRGQSVSVRSPNIAYFVFARIPDVSVDFLEDCGVLI